MATHQRWEYAYVIAATLTEQEIQERGDAIPGSVRAERPVKAYLAVGRNGEWDEVYTPWERLRGLGNDGWELACEWTAESCLVFERPLDE